MSVSEEDCIIALRDKIRNMVREFHITLEGNQIVIDGICRLYYHKQMAQQEAMRIFPRHQLYNNIRVQ